MKWWMCWLVLVPGVLADEFRARVEGAGCRTRQLTIQRIWEQLPEVETVTILPRKQRPAPNQRDFILRCPDATPTAERLNEALGRRAAYYRVIQLTPLDPAEEDA
jgi:hypothetical protein